MRYRTSESNRLDKEMRMKDLVCIWFTKCGVKQFVIVPREAEWFAADSIRMFGGEITSRMSKEAPHGYKLWEVNKVIPLAAQS